MKLVLICLEFLWKGIVIGFLDLVAVSVAGGILINIGMKFPEITSSFRFITIIMFLSGFIISIIGGIIVKKLRLKKSMTILTLFLIFFLNSITQIMEALFFAPGIVDLETAPALLIQQFFMYLVISVGIALLFQYDGGTVKELEGIERSWGGWLGRILISSGSYVLFYWVFGSINAMLITGEYYRSEVSGLHLPSTAEILMLEPIRAVLLVLSVLPLVIYLGVSKKKCAVIVGMVLFIIGGLLPMLQQLNTLPIAVAVSSIFEMFFQFFLTGIAITYVIRYDRFDAGEKPSAASLK